MKEESINNTPAIFAIIVVVSLFVATLIASQNASTAVIPETHGTTSTVVLHHKHHLLISCGTK
jgi:hypothetical protein